MRILNKAVGELRDVHQPILVHADVYKGSEVGDVRDDALENLYRDGTCSILEHTDLASVVRIRALMRWTAFWLVLIL